MRCTSTPSLVPLEIDAIIPDPEAVQGAALLDELAELVQFRAHHLLRQAAKIAEDLQLQFLGHPRQFGGGGRRENNLERIHENGRGMVINGSDGARTRMEIVDRYMMT